MQYRRDYTNGATYFFTVVLFRRRHLFVDGQIIDLLRKAFKAEMTRRPFDIEAIVVMPDHIHTIWKLPDDDSDYSTRWRNIKRYFTAAVADKYNFEVSAARQHKKEQAIWQRRFWEYRIKDEEDFIRCVEYIHYNPVKHGYVINPADWKYSSIHKYISQGFVAANWGSGITVSEDNDIFRE